MESKNILCEIIENNLMTMIHYEHAFIVTKLFSFFADQTTYYKTDFPRPDLTVNCLSDGVQVEITLSEIGFNGILYVKGHSKDEKCRRVVSIDTGERIEYFKVHFGECGLIHVNVSNIVYSLKSYKIANNKPIYFYIGTKSRTETDLNFLFRVKPVLCWSSRNIPNL